MTEAVFQRILSHGLYDMLLTSTDDGYTVRLTKRLSNEDSKRMGGLTREPVRMTHAPGDLAVPSIGVFYRARAAWRSELVGWIKAELSRHAVERLHDIPVPAGRRQWLVSDFDFRMRVMEPRDIWPPETVVVSDDLADLDGSRRGLWRAPDLRDDSDDWAR